MRKTKFRLEEFALFDYVGVERHLEKMAAKGWRLSEIAGNVWVYKKAEPANVKYAVTYIPKVSAYDPVETDETIRLNEYCESAGWTKVTDWLQMQIYSTEDPLAKPLETDEAVRLDAIRRAMRKSYLFSHVLFLLIFLLQGYSLSVSYGANPITFWAQNYNLYLIAVLLSGTVFTIFNLVYLGLWLRKSRKSVEAGGSCVPVRKFRMVSRLSLIWIGVLFLLMLYSVDITLAVILVVALVAYFIYVYVIQALRIYLRHKGAEKSTNIVVTLLAAILFAIVFMFGTGKITSYYIANRKVPDDTYYANDIWWDIYYDNLPVVIEDLQETGNVQYSYEMEEMESMLLSYKICDQTPVPYGTDAPRFSYEVLDVKVAGMYDWCLKQYLNKYDNMKIYVDDASSDVSFEELFGFREVEISDWEIEDEIGEEVEGVIENENRNQNREEIEDRIQSDVEIDKLYRNYYEGELGNEWIICKGNLIIYIDAEWELTDVQMRTMVAQIVKAESLENENLSDGGNDLSESKKELHQEGNLTEQENALPEQNPGTRKDSLDTEVLLDERAYQLSDGTYVKCLGSQDSYDLSYRLEDGTMILSVCDKLLFYTKEIDSQEIETGKNLQKRSEFWGIGEVKNLSDEAKEAICTYLESMDLGYDVETALENAYADYQDNQGVFSDFQFHDIRRYMSVVKDWKALLSYECSLYTPKLPHFTGYYEGRPETFYFDKTTGQRVSAAAFFTLPEDELCEYLIDCWTEYEPETRELVERYFSLDYVFINEGCAGVSDSIVEIRFPEGTIDSFEQSMFWSYEEMKDILQPWVVPESMDIE